MPSYQVFNHKTGSVSSNYSTHSTFSTFDHQLHSGVPVDGQQDPHPDET